MSSRPSDSTDVGLLNSGLEFSKEKIDLIKRTVAKDATDDELELFLYQCKRTGLDPLSKQIYFQKRLNRKTGRSDVTVMTAIDGYRVIAHRTGLYAGADPTIFDSEKDPKKATVTVYKMVNGVRCPFTASARWDQYFPGDAQGFMWRKMPHTMLEKCAESLALRKAFPADLSGIYTTEEMQQVDNEPKEPSRLVPPKFPPMPVIDTTQKEIEEEAINEVIGKTAGAFVITFGKYRGEPLSKLLSPKGEHRVLENYYDWVEENQKEMNEKFNVPQEEIDAFLLNARRFLTYLREKDNLK